MESMKGQETEQYYRIDDRGLQSLLNGTDDGTMLPEDYTEFIAPDATLHRFSINAVQDLGDRFRYEARLKVAWDTHQNSDTPAPDIVSTYPFHGVVWKEPRSSFPTSMSTICSKISPLSETYSWKGKCRAAQEL